MAFPTTPVLDTFSGTLGSWTTPIFGDSALTITGGAVTSSAAGGWGSGVWTASFGADQEMYVTLGTIGSTEMGFCWRVTDNTSSIDGYICTWAVGGNILIDRYVNGTPTNVFPSTAIQALSNGDSVGVSMIGTAITIYYKAAAGSWTSVVTDTDGGISSSGQIGMSLFGNVWRADNFGGGAVVVPVTYITGYLRAYGPAAFATTAADLYTVPTGCRYTIRNLHVNNPSGGEIEFTLSVGNDAAGTRLLDQHAVGAGESYVSRRAANHTIEAGEKIQGFADSTAPTVVIDGFLQVV